MRASVIAGLAVVIVAVIAAFQYEAIEDWFSTEEAKPRSASTTAGTDSNAGADAQGTSSAASASTTTSGSGTAAPKSAQTTEPAEPAKPTKPAEQAAVAKTGSAPASTASKPAKPTESQTTAMAKTAPTVAKAAPTVAKAAPTVAKAAPTVAKAAPTVAKAAPTVAKAAPTVAKAAPTVAKAAPTVAKAAPTVAKAAPTVAKTAPTVAKAAPTVAKAAPTVAKAAPTVAKAAPTVAKAAPTVAKAAPTVAKAAPTVAKTPPTVAKAAPTVAKQRFGVVRVVPADEDGKSADDSDGIKPPSFDVVRVNPKGDAVIAGRAEPGAEVTIKDAGDVVGKVTADKRGEWVLVPEKPFPSGARQLSLQEKTTSGEEKSSKDVVVLFVPEKKPGGSGQQAEAVAVLSPREGQGASKILQAPAPVTSGTGDSPKPKSEKDLTLKVIDYDEEGRVVLSGKAPPGSEVRAKVDGKTVGTATADKAGDWQISPPAPVVSGQHAIRIEQIGKSGIVLAKLNVPFSRATVRPGTLAPGTIVVEPGNSLWRIARATYGEGTKYTLIFAANSEQIGNPNVIFPGQIFVLPPDTASN